MAARTSGRWNLRRSIVFLLLIAAVVVAISSIPRSCSEPAEVVPAPTGALGSRTNLIRDVGRPAPRARGAEVEVSVPAMSGDDEPPTGGGSDRSTAEAGAQRLRFDLPSIIGVDGPDRSAWSRKYLRIHPLCVVEIPGTYPTEDFEVTLVCTDRDGTTRDEKCPVVRLHAGSIVAALALPDPPERTTFTLVLSSRGGVSDRVEVPLHHRRSFVPLDARQQIVRLLDFGSAGTALRRAFDARVAAGDGPGDAADAVRRDAERIAQLLRAQFDPAGHPAERPERKDALEVVETTLRATRIALERSSADR